MACLGAWRNSDFSVFARAFIGDSHGKKFGPRGVIHSWAQPGGNQRIDDTGPLNKARMSPQQLATLELASMRLGSSLAGATIGAPILQAAIFSCRPIAIYLMLGSFCS